MVRPESVTAKVCVALATPAPVMGWPNPSKLKLVGEVANVASLWAVKLTVAPVVPLGPVRVPAVVQLKVERPGNFQRHRGGSKVTQTVRRWAIAVFWANRR
jgi:hypothetical protein